MSNSSNILQIHSRKAMVASPAEIASQLGNPVRLKTWSLIVTVFGDAILPHAGSISAISLGQIMEKIGVEAGAVRTAISRLASDGWIERERDGRASFYRLAVYREEIFRRAEKKIYAGPIGEKEPSEWAVCLLPPDSETSAKLTDHAITLQKNWHLIDLRKKPDVVFPSEAMIFKGDFLQRPAWFLEMLAPEDLAHAMDRLIGVFSPLLAALQNGWQPTPIEAISYRCLLIHNWRRIALKLRGLPSDMVPSDWPEDGCRTMISDLYCELIALSENWLKTEARCKQGAMPQADPLLFERFGGILYHY